VLVHGLPSLWDFFTFDVLFKVKMIEIFVTGIPQVVEVNVKAEELGIHNVHNNAFYAEETIRY